ncbi:type II CAAX prenyl endopeptidase Rce1 family protein [Chloroflexota bacterium]
MEIEDPIDSKNKIPILIKFFTLAYLISWFIWGLLVIFPRVMGEMYFLIIFGAFGPFAAAAILIRIYHGKEKAKNWLKNILRWKGRLWWNLLAGLGIPFGIALTHILIYSLLFGLSPLQSDPPWYWLIPAIPVNVYVVFVYSSAFGEEPGWQGFAMPRLLKHFTPIISSSILGVLWALWHIPLHFTNLWAGNESLLWMTVYAIPLAMILTWLTQKAKGSVMPAIFLHYATNLYGGYLSGTEIFKLPLDMQFTQIKTVIYWIIALFLVWRTRGTLGYNSLEDHFSLDK